jgi:hypothetical protein
MVTDPVRALNSDDFSMKLEAELKELLRLLDNEVCSTSPELIVNKPVKALNMEFFSARLKPRVKEPVTILKIEFFPATPDAVVIEEVGLRVQLVATPA